MGYIDIRKARIQTRLTKTSAAIDALYSQYEALSASTTASYEFDSGEGRQRTSRRSLKDIKDQIDRLEATERSLLNDLYNMGIVNIRLRRKQPTGYPY